MIHIIDIAVQIEYKQWISLLVSVAVHMGAYALQCSCVAGRVGDKKAEAATKRMPFFDQMTGQNILHIFVVIMIGFQEKK